MQQQALAKVRVFDPKHWGEVTYFTKFHAATHVFGSAQKKALQGVTSHYEKSQVLLNVARKIRPNLAIDRQQLLDNGFTPALNAQEFSAVIEEVFTELYSVIDCTRKIIVATRCGCRGMPSDSTRKLFKAVAEKTISSEFPAPLKEAIANATWYTSLLFLRDELTHLSIGSCRRTGDGEAVSYTHRGMLVEGKPLIIDDVIGHAETLADAVNKFTEAVFAFLNSELRPTEIHEPCLFAYGRIYMRLLTSARPITLDSGTCLMRASFDSDPEFRCPIADDCGAYKMTA